MADVVTTAIYKLSVQGTADIQKADAAIAALSSTQDKAVASADRLAASTVTVTKTEENVTTVKRTSTSQLDRWIASMDKATRANQVYQSSLQRIAQYEAEGTADATKLATATQLVTDRYNAQIASLNKMATASNENAKIAQVHSNAIKGVGEAAKISFTDMEILRSGVINTAQSLAAGVGAAKTFETQLFQIGPAIPGLIARFGSLGLAIGGIGAVVAVAGAGFLLLLSRVEEAQARLRNYTAILSAMGTGTNTTALGLESIAKSLRDTGTSAADAQRALQAFARVPGINAGAAATLSPLARDIGSVTGEDFVQVQTKMATAFATSTAAAIKFVQEVAGPNGLTATEITNMQTMAAHGDRAGALATAIAALQRQFGGKFTEQMSDSSKAITSIGAAWDNMLTKLSETRAVGTARDAIIGMLNGIAGAASGAATAVAQIPEAPTAGNVATPSIGTGGATIPGAAAALRNRQAAGLSAPTLSVGGAISSIANSAANIADLNSEVGNRVNVWLGMLTDAERATLSIGPRSAVRTIQESADIKAQGGIAATPGGSAHNPAYAIAVDISGMSQSAADKLALAGLHQPVPGDSIHVEPIETLSAATSSAAARQQSFADFVRLHPGSLGAATTGGGSTQFGSGVFPNAVTPQLPLQSGTPPVLAGPELSEADKQNMADTLKFQQQMQSALAMTGTSQTWWTTYLQNLGAGTKDNKDIWVAMSAANDAVSRQGIENTKAAQTQQITNDLGIKTAEAYGQDVVSGYQAAAKAEAELAVRNGTANDVASKTAEILQTQAVSAIASGAAQVAASKREEEAQARLLDAATQGTGALHDQQVANEGIARTQDAYNKALATGDQALIARAKALQDASVEETKRLDILKTSTEIQEKIAGNKDQIDVLKLETQLQGQSADEINRQVTLLQTKQALDAKGASVTQEQRDALMKNTEELTKQQALLSQAQQNQQRINDTLTSIGQTIDSAITQNIEAALSGQKITAWHDIFKQTLVQIEGQLLSLSVIKPAIGSVLGFLGFGGAAQSFGSLFSGAGILNPSGGGIFSGSTGTAGVTGGAQIVDSQGNVLGTISQGASLLSSGSNLFGGGGGLFGGSGGIGGFINNNIGTSLGFAPTGLLPGSGAGAGIFTNAATGATSDIAGSGVAGGLFGGTTLTSALGGVAAGATAGSLLNSLLGPSIGGGKTLGGTIGSTGGALAGAIIGSIIPGIGTLIGGLVGGSAGGLLGGLFGAGKPNLASSGSVNLATGQLGAFTSGGVAANDQTSQAILQPIGSALSQITSILGASVLPQATLVAQAGSRDGIKVNIASGEGVKSFTGSDAGTVVQEVAQFLSQHMDLSGLSPTLGKIVSTLSLDQLQSADALTAAKQFADAYDQIKTAADQSFASVESGAQVAGPFEQAMTQITTTFGQLSDQATQYGLSLDPINAALAEATKRLNVDFAKAVDAAFNTASGSDFLNGIQSIVDNYQSMAREASAIGASGDVFNKLGQTFDDSLKTVFSSLTSTQLNQVIAQFGDLTNDLPALATTARDAAAATEALNAQLAQQTQIYQNQQNAYTAAGQGFLAQLRDLDQARIAAQAANASVGLGADQNAIVQETEHQAALNILMGLTTDQMEQARAVLADLNPAFAQWVDEAEAGVAATQAQADAQARANTILSAQANIQAYLNQLQTASSAFTDPKSRLDAAQSQYNTMLAAAQGGDLDALQGITTAAQTLLQNVSDYYASSAPGQAIFQQVQQQLQGLLGTVGPGTTTATTADVVDAINNSAAGTTATLNDQTAQIVNAGIASSKAITDNAIQANGTILAAAKVANDNIVNTTISTATDITNATLQGAASVVGGSAQQFTAQTATLVTSTQTVTDATNTATAAVVSSGATVYGGTVALLNSNVANSANLIANNTANAISTMQGNEQNAATLQAAGAAQTGAIIDGNTANALTITQRTTDTTNSLISANDSQTAALAATAQVTTDRAISAATGNSTTVIGAISAWSSALLNSQVAWDNATIGTLNYWFGGLYSVTANGSNGVVQATFAAADSIVGTVAAWANYGIGISAANANSIVSTETTTSNNEIAAIYGAANSMISATTALGGSGTTDAVNNATANIVGWGQNLYNAIGGLTSNEVAWNQNVYNKLQEILDNMIGWNRNLWDQLNNIREYITFLAEVTVQFDEFMAGAQGAQLDTMNGIQTTLRRQAFG